LNFPSNLAVGDAAFAQQSKSFTDDYEVFCSAQHISLLLQRRSSFQVILLLPMQPLGDERSSPPMIMKCFVVLNMALAFLNDAHRRHRLYGEADFRSS
jgi:hypothetical protein